MRTCGTYSSYCAGCRCEACTEANTERSRQQRLDPAFREADAARARAYRAANLDTVRDAEFVRKYGITLEERDRRFELQGRCCPLCGTADFGQRGPQVDHIHGTKIVRAILCVKCNVGIGAFDDDPPRLRTAADYVEKHRDPLFGAGTSAGLLF